MRKRKCTKCEEDTKDYAIVTYKGTDIYICHECLDENVWINAVIDKVKD